MLAVCNALLSDRHSLLPSSPAFQIFSHSLLLPPNPSNSHSLHPHSLVGSSSAPASSSATMFAPSRLFVLFALALSASSLATPHVGRSPHSHHALAARKAAPEPVPVAAPLDAQVVRPKKLRRRSDTSRCRVKSSSAAASSVAATSSASEAASTTAVPAAVEAAPTTTSKAATTEAKPSSTSTKATTTKATKTTSSKAASTTSSASSSGGSEPSFLIGTQTGQGAFYTSFRIIVFVLIDIIGTFYATGLGACGITNNDGQRIAAVSHLLFDVFPCVMMFRLFSPYLYAYAFFLVAMMV